MNRTKVVLRHLPPTITRETLFEQIDQKGFADRYYWQNFCPGKSSHKRFSYSRAYIAFNKPEDVMEFAEFFNGHVFVNEKGSQFKTIVEYAPSQRVPNNWSKKDGREGAICRDPEYLEFLEYLAKPVENLPSAEIQLERTEKSAATKDAPIVTPLMDFVRQKRAAKGVSRRLSSNGKPGRKAGASSSGGSNSISSKRGSDKKRVSTTMYVLRDSAKAKSSKDKRPYVLGQKHDEQLLFNKPVTSSLEIPDGSQKESGSATVDAGKKKFLLLRGKEKEACQLSGSISQQQVAVSPIRDVVSAPKQSLRRESSGKYTRSILTDNSQGLSAVRSDHQIQMSTVEKDKRPPRPSHVQLGLKGTNGISGDRAGNDLHGYSSEKYGRRARARDRPDRGVWTPRRPEGVHSSDESLSYSNTQSSQSPLDSSAGSYRHGRRGPHGLKDVDGSNEGKPLKRGFSSYGFHEKQVWVQKSATGS